MKKIHDADGRIWCHLFPMLFLILLFICFPLYLLADNAQPLDCDFGCDFLAKNKTLNALSCNAYGNSALRLSFTLVTFIIITSMFTPGIICLGLFIKSDSDDYIKI